MYRLLRKPFAATPFDGEGSYRYGGRWSAPGTRIAYTAEHLSLAMIEYLVHLDPNHPPKDLMLARARVPEALPKLQLRADELPSGWQDYPAPESLAAHRRQVRSQWGSCGLDPAVRGGSHREQLASEPATSSFSEDRTGAHRAVSIRSKTAQAESSQEAIIRPLTHFASSSTKSLAASWVPSTSSCAFS